MVGRAAVLACLAALPVTPAAAAEGALPGGRAIVVKASVSPDTHLFAEPIVARVDVVLDPTELDPDRIRVNLDFEPYELVGALEETRRAVGQLVRLRYTATLRCLHVGCIAARFQTVLGEQEAGRPERHAIRFQPAEIVYEREGGRAEVLLQRPFPTVEVVSRLNAAQVEEAQLESLGGTESYRASVEPPPPTYRMPPRLLAAVSLAAAFLLFSFPAVLAGRLVHARWRASRRPRPLSPLERALVLVAWTARRADGDEDRRKALEALAVVAKGSGAESLAEATRALAWDRESPGGDQADELAAQARSTLAGGGNGRPA